MTRYPPKIIANLRQLAQIVRAKGREVIFRSLGPPLAPKGYGSSLWGKRRIFNPSTRKLLARYDSGDGMHPNTAGHRVIAADALPDVERALMRMGLRAGR